MGNERSRFSEEPMYLPKMTEKQAAEMRAVFDRGLSNEPAVEIIQSFYDPINRRVIGCSKDFPFERLSGMVEALSQQELSEKEVFDKLELQEIRRFAAMGPNYIIFSNETACLLRVAILAELLAKNELFLKSPDTFFDLAGLIVQVCEVVIKRTQGRYGFLGGQTYQPLDKAILTVSPIKDHANWQSLYEQKKRVMSGKALVSPPVPVEEEPINLNDKDGWEKVVEEIERNLDSNITAAEIGAAATGDMPEVNKSIKNLKLLKFSDIERQSRAKYSFAVRDDTVHEHVELMVYHSVVSVVLDKDGNPAFLRGFPYALIVPGPGQGLEKRLQPRGLYLGTGKLADYQFKVKGKEVKTILFGGIGGFVETLNTFTWEHELHTKLQTYIDFQGFYALPTIIVEEAFGAGEFSIGKARSEMDTIIERTGKYIYAEIVRRLENLYENYQEILLDLTVEFVKGIVVDKVKEWARDFLIKKILKKFIPGVNLISAVEDLLDDEQTEMIRAAVACIVIAVKSKRTDDLTISSKVLAKIGVDKVQEKVVQAIQNKAQKTLVRKVKSAIKSKAKTEPKPETPKPEPPPESPTPQPDAGASKTPDPNAARGTGDRYGHRSVPTRDDIEQGRRVADELTKAKAKSDAEAEQKRKKTEKPADTGPADDKPKDPKSTGDPALDSKMTDGKSTDSTSTTGTSSDARSTPKTKKDPPPEPPMPPSTATTKEKLEFYQKHKDQYPEHVRNWIDAETAKAATRKPSGVGRKGGENINKVIDDENKKGGKQYEAIPKNLSGEERLDYLKKNRDKYPPNVQKKIDEQIEMSASRTANAGKTDLDSIDQEIRADHAMTLEKHYNVPIVRVKRRETHSKGENKGEDKPGTDTEKTNISERTGKRPQLSVVSKTKDGEEVEIDDLYVDKDGKLIAREHKSSLDIPQKPGDEQERDIQGRMDKQARWAEERDARYEWVYHSKEDGDKMIKAKAALVEQANNTSDPNLREKLKQRYRRIEIVPYPYDE